jgi:hypothetical protein
MSNLAPAAFNRHEPSTCPWCGLAKKVYVRAGGELVCTDCNKEAQAIEATWLDGLPTEGEE